MLHVSMLHLRQGLPWRHQFLAPLYTHHTPHLACLQTCTGDKDQATFNLKLALKLSGTLLYVVT
jgi:hypothetical protein